MNPFQKNPFVKNIQPKIIGNYKQFDEKQKISNIRESMANTKIENLNQKEKEIPNLSVNEKINLLKNIK